MQCRWSHEAVHLQTKCCSATQVSWWQWCTFSTGLYSVECTCTVHASVAHQCNTIVNVTIAVEEQKKDVAVCYMSAGIQQMCNMPLSMSYKQVLNLLQYMQLNALTTALQPSQNYAHASWVAFHITARQCRAPLSWSAFLSSSGLTPQQICSLSAASWRARWDLALFWCRWSHHGFCRCCRDHWCYAHGTCMCPTSNAIHNNF